VLVILDIENIYMCNQLIYWMHYTLVLFVFMIF